MAVVVAAAGRGGGEKKFRQVLVYRRVTFLQHITQIEHKITILNSAVRRGCGIYSLILYTVCLYH
jgi:hypothetical protein